MGLNVVESPDRTWGVELVALRNFRKGDLLAVYTGEVVPRHTSSGAYSVQVCMV